MHSGPSGQTRETGGGATCGRMGNGSGSLDGRKTAGQPVDGWKNRWEGGGRTSGLMEAADGGDCLIDWKQDVGAISRQMESRARTWEMGVDLWTDGTGERTPQLVQCYTISASPHPLVSVLKRLLLNHLGSSIARWGCPSV